MNKLNIDILTNDGSPLNTHYTDVYGENGRIGLGGAELALHTLCKGWHDAGHRVRLYNDPTHIGGSPYKQYPISTFSPRDDRDVLIIFRSPNDRIDGARGLKVWWSCDQYTIGDFTEFAKKVDKIVTISKFHARHFSEIYKIENTITIDLPVRVEDYDGCLDEKVDNRLIFCSVPDRGLSILASAYGEIREEVPDVSLIITSDYRLWGSHYALNEQYISKFMDMPGVKFLGAVPRRELIVEQLKAQIQAYPCNYDELFCIASAECQVAGVIPITSTIGALDTTNMGIKISGNVQSHEWRKTFVDAVISTLKNPELKNAQNLLRKRSIERFSLGRILKIWDKRVFNG